MWTAENRRRYDRSRLRYPSDLTDEEWALVAPEIVINMIRQAAIAIGVALFVVIVGTPDSLQERIAAFRHARWMVLSRSPA